MPVAPPKVEPCNYFHLSRKCERAQPVFSTWGVLKKRPSHYFPGMSPISLAAITGTYVINPELYLPDILLNVFDDPVSQLPSSKRRPNLRLEVENGGINVDVRLVPSVSDRTRTGDPKTAKTAKSHKPKHQNKPTTINIVPSCGTSNQNEPTTIDLRIRKVESKTCPSPGNSKNVIEITPFPLIARIHAPNPRPPLHLFASTIDYVPNPTADSIINHLTPPSCSSSCSQLKSPSSSSPLYLHLPRTFRGSLSIHTSSGIAHWHTHLRLSGGLKKEVVLIRETVFGRGYVVGGLGWDGKETDERGMARLARVDRAEIAVGSGDVYLQFGDESEPFGKISREIGVWKKDG